jgi:hypothetical protein
MRSLRLMNDAAAEDGRAPMMAVKSEIIHGWLPGYSGNLKSIENANRYSAGNAREESGGCEIFTRFA